LVDNNMKTFWVWIGCETVAKILVVTNKR